MKLNALKPTKKLWRSTLRATALRSKDVSRSVDRGTVAWPEDINGHLAMKKNPPIVQLLLTVQFQPAAASLSILDWAELRARFAGELPIFAQIPRAGPMPAQPGQILLEAPFGLPRLSMTSSDLSNILMLQDDRISVGWQRTSPLASDPNYPGFTATLQRSLETISAVLAFIKERATETVALSVGELSYTDAFITHTEGKSLRKMEDIFTCIRSNEQFSFNAFNMIFQRRLNFDAGDGFNGMAETAISGLIRTPDGNDVVNLLTVIRFELSETPLNELPVKYGLAHKVAEDVFSTLVKPEAYAILDPL